MRVSFKPSFVRDFKKLPSEIRKEVKYICVEVFPKLRDIRSFQAYPIRPIKGFKGYYRMKIGDHRIGFKKKKDGSVEFMRAKHRKDIYRHFPNG
ncbi:type II toxin-antitoxin system RelE/ParE family toxin [Patescibacteria group bacterium]|nr:type II toxin-antitoxin system RelE/ParE family toxin [Patescibacteria group bacterium]